MPISRPKKMEEAGSFARVWLEVDLDSLVSNFGKIRETARQCEVLCVLKADGYGLGAGKIARRLESCGGRKFGVATVDEALALLPAGGTIQIMSAVFPEELPELIRANVELPVTDLGMAREIGKTALKLGRVAKCHVKVDSGMGRLGIPIKDADRTIPSIFGIKGIEPVGIFSHFPMSSHPDAEFSARQTREMSALIARLEKASMSFRWRHIANSDAIMGLKDASMPPFNMVRTGLALYGLADDSRGNRPWMREVAALRSKLVSVRKLPSGHSVGYGRSHRLSKETLVGTIAAGYADGLPLALSNRGRVLLRGHPVPVIGRISMDYTTVDLSSVPDAAAGETVTLFGSDRDGAIPVQEWAWMKGTHPYDIICSVAPRVKRLYFQQGDF